MPEFKYIRPPLYSYQTRILNSPARFTVTLAATKVGKTASHIIAILEAAMQCKANQSCWWISPTYSQARMSYNRLKTQISDRRLFTCNETELCITLITGAKIFFKTAEKPDHLFGEDVYFFIYDEFTRGREESWHALRSTIAATGGRGKFIGNVRGSSGWGHKLAMKAKSGEDPNYEYFKITAFDAAAAGMLTKDGRPFIEEIRDAKRELPENVFRELYCAEPTEDGSNPFGFTHIDRCTYPMSTRPAVCFGVDVASTHDFTVITGLDKFGQVCYFDRFQCDWLQVTQRILALPRGIICIDATGVGKPIAEQISKVRETEYFIFTQQSKQELINTLVYAIQRREITFPEGVITDELKAFETEYTKNGVSYSSPLHDDTVMSLGLACRVHKNAATYGEISVW